jgi:hypothetical protein
MFACSLYYHNGHLLMGTQLSKGYILVRGKHITGKHIMGVQMIDVKKHNKKIQQQKRRVIKLLKKLGKIL